MEQVPPSTVQTMSAAGLPLLAVAVLVTGCGAGRGGAAVAIDTLPGGIVRTVASMPSDSGRWQLVLERTLLPDDNSPGSLGRITSLALAEDGTLFVSDEDERSIKVFDSEGNWLRTIGRDGSGPGEFQTGPALALTGTTLIANDARAARVTLFDLSSPGAPVIHPAPCCNYNRIGVDGEGNIILPAIDDSDTTENMLRMVTITGERDTLTFPQTPIPDEASWHYLVNGRRQFSMTPPFLPRNQLLSDPTGDFLLAWEGSYRLIRVNGSGDTVAIFGRQHAPQPISEAARKEAIETRITSMTRSFPEEGLRATFTLDKVPAVYPAFGWIDIDRSGRTWVRLVGPDTATVVLDLFDRDGIWLDQIPVPASGWPAENWAPTSWGRDHVAVASADEDDRPRVLIYRIERH